MMQRCYNKNSNGYKRYGGRGIQVCDRWHTFTNFYTDMGEKPEGMSLDRIDNDADYSPENCKWSTRQEQTLNRKYSRPTHCLRGHSFSGSNVRVYQNKRKCMACCRIRDKERYKRKIANKEISL